MKVHPRCKRVAETLPTLQHDPNRPEDVLEVDSDGDGIGGDDCADCLRYLVASKSRTIAQRKLRGLQLRRRLFEASKPIVFANIG